MRITRSHLLWIALFALAACQSSEGVEEDPSFLEGGAVGGGPSGPSTAMPPGQEPGAQQPGDPSLDAAREAIQVREGKRKLLASTFLSQADDAFARGDYQGAMALYADALQLDPESREARDGLRRSQDAMGDGTYEIDSAEDRLAQAQIRWAQRRLQVEGLVQDGDRSMAEGDFEEAVNFYRSAELALRATPSLQSGTLDQGIVSSKLQAALDAQDSAASAVRAAETAAAEAEAAAAREARDQYLQNRVRTLFSEANSQFRMGFYDRATATLDAILELDPRNQEARELREVANSAWHAQRERRTAARFREQWRLTFDELRRLTVPPKSIIEHDVDYWRKNVLVRQPLDQVTIEEEVDPTVALIEDALANTRIEPRFDNPIEEIADNLAAYTRVNFVVSRAVREDLDEDTKNIRMAFARPMPVSQILSIIEDLTNNEVKFVIRNGVVNVVTTEEDSGGQVRRHYEVRDIVRPVRDFVGTEINLSPSGGIDEVEEEIPEREATILTEDDLVSAIQENIDPDSWDDVGTLSIENGTLIVYHTPAVQARVQQLLDDLRKASNIMVEIKVRFLKVEDSFLQDIGVDFRGLGDDATSGIPGKGDDFVFDDFGADPGSPGSPGTIGTGNDAGLYFREADDNVNIISRTENLYDAGLGSEDSLIGSGGLSLQYAWLDDTQVEMVLRAVEKSRRSEILTEPKLMVFNTSRATLTVANQVSYVGDFDVEIAQAAAIADPVVRVAKDGVFLDVRPVVSADRRFTFIDVRPTVATLRRPIPSFSTSLGTGAPVTLQLPELEVQKIRTRVMIPDGGTLLLGGLKTVAQQDLESGVPVLSQIPILSFFFSRKGTFETYQKLIILLTSRVVIPEEFEPTELPGSVR